MQPAQPLAIAGGVRIQLKGVPPDLDADLVRQAGDGLLQARIANGAPGAGNIGNNVDLELVHGGSR